MMPRARFLLALVPALVGGCKQPGPPSIVGDFAAPGIYALAGDTITVWRRDDQEGRTTRLRAYSITPSGTVEGLEEMERTEVSAGEPEEAEALPGERRRSFALPPQEFAAIRAQAALLRPQSLGPEDPVGGYGGQAAPTGCSFVPGQSGSAGVNYLNGMNWGAFVLQPACRGASADAARATLADMFLRLDHAAALVPSTQR